MTSPERTADTERRHATVMFADISGFTAISEKIEVDSVFAIITGCLQRLDGVVRRYGGSVEKYEGDAILATFGVPFTLEEAPKAAVNAAIEMFDEVAHYNEECRPPHPLQIHIGINSGLVISGDVSGPLIREFVVMGDTVNVAARLKDLAPKGEVWVGPETYRYTRGDFEYRALGPQQLKGHAPVPVFQLTSRETRLGRRPPGGARRLYAPFVERDVELASLEEMLDAVAKGRGGIVSVVGEAGIGKSRLIAELQTRTRVLGIRFLRGRSNPHGQRLSYHPFADLLRDWSASREFSGEDASRALSESIATLMGSAAPEVVPFLLTLAGLPVGQEDKERLRGLEGEALEKLALGAAKRWLAALAAEAPVTLIFEDVHWADASSVRLLEQLLGQATRFRVLFLLVARPGFTETSDRLRSAAEARHADLHRLVSLDPLSETKSHTLIEHFFHRSDAPGTLRAQIADRAGGNPFYVEEVIRSLIDEGALEERDGVLWLGAGGGAVSIPETIREVVMSRVDRLTPRQKQLLQLLAVVGRNISHRLVRQLAGAGEPLDADVAQLADLLLIVEDAEGFVFRHALIREIAYDSILMPERPGLHLRVAESIEQAIRPGEIGTAALLAYHFGLADAEDSAEHYLFQAGEEAVRSAASDEALQFFQEASDRYQRLHGEGGDPRKRAALEKNIALAYHIRGDLEASVHFTRALELLGEGGRKGRVRDDLRLAATLARVARTLRRGRIARRRGPAGDREREIIALMTYRAEAETTGDPRRFLFDTIETHRVLGRVDPKSVRGGGGLIAGLVGVFSFGGLSFGLGERALRLAEQLADPDDVAEQIMLGFMGFTHHFLVGDWDAKHHIDPELLDEGLRTGRFGRLWHVTNYLGLVTEQLVYQGEFTAAAERMELIAKIAELYAYNLARSTHQYTRAVAMVQRGRLEDALAACTEHYTQNREDNLNILALAERARVHALLGNLEAARESARDAQTIVDRVGVFAPYLRTPLVVPYYLSSLARSRFLIDLLELERALERSSGPTPRALVRAARASGQAAERLAASVSWRRPEIHRLHGSFAWLRRRPRVATRRWERSLAEAAALGMKPDLARTHREVSRRLATTGAAAAVAGLDAIGHERAARELFEALEIEPEGSA